MARSGAGLQCRLMAILLAIAIAGMPAVHASDPQAYTVDFASTGNGELDAALKAALSSKRCEPRDRSGRLRWLAARSRTSTDCRRCCRLTAITRGALTSR